MPKRRRGKLLYKPPPGLTIEEDKKIQRLCLIPVLIVMIPFLILLAGYVRNPPQALWSFHVDFVIPFTVSGAFAAMISYEILYYRRVKGSLRFHTIRIVGRLFLQILTSITIFSLTIFISLHLMSPFISQPRAYFAGFLLGGFLLIIILFKIRRLIRKFEKGLWL